MKRGLAEGECYCGHGWRCHHHAKPRKPIQRKARLASRKAIPQRRPGKPRNSLSRHFRRRGPKPPGKQRISGLYSIAYIKWIRTLPCVLAEKHQCVGPIQCCHVKSRGAGGVDRANCYPGCVGAHRQQHQIGIKSFQALWDLDLPVLALQLDAGYEAQVEPRRFLRLTEADEAEMERLYTQDGLSTVEIASRFDILPGSVWNRLKQRGVQMSMHRPRKAEVRLSRGYYQIRGERLHRIVAAQKLGRPLLPGESVHHINGITTDNRPENLEVFPSHSAHMAAHRAERTKWTPVEYAELKRLYLADYSRSKIAELLGKTKAAVGNRITRLQRAGELPVLYQTGRKPDKTLERAGLGRTHCRYGHPYPDGSSSGSRFCRQCRRKNQAAWKERQRAGAA